MSRKWGVIIEDPRRMAEVFAGEFTNHLQRKTASAAGTAIAAVLTGKERRDVTDEEAAHALSHYHEGNDVALRNAAARAGVTAMLAALEPYVPQRMIAEVVHAFTGLDGGVARGIATPTKTRRREGAPDYDALAIFIAAEVVYTRKVFGIRSIEGALMQVTGISRPGTKNAPDPQKAHAPLHAAGMSWKQLDALYKRGIALPEAAARADDATAAAKTVRSGEDPDPDFMG